MGRTSAALAAMAARRPSKERIIEVLREKAGIVAAAARTLGVHRSTLYNWMEEDESGEIAAAMADIRETVTDLAEGKLLENIEKGRSEDIRFYLRCFGRSRGYIEVVRHEDADGGTIRPQIDPTPPRFAGFDLTKMTYEDIELLRRLEAKRRAPTIEAETVPGAPGVERVRVSERRGGE